MSPPLSTPLSQLLVAFTIELDNEFERRMAALGVGRRFGISLVMWSNFLRFVGDGVRVGELPGLAGLPKARLLSKIGGMERWRYVFVDSDGSGREPDAKRDGWGSGRAVRGEWLVRPTAAGRAAQEIWPPLFGEIETRWQERFGARAVGELRHSLEALVEDVDGDLPEYLPIVVGANGFAAEVAERERTGARDADTSQLSALLARALLAYTLEFERASPVSRPISANFLRVLDRDTYVRELTGAAGVSKEATTMALTFLTKAGYVVVSAGKRVSFTASGRAAHEAARGAHRHLERSWRARFGADRVARLERALEGILDQRDALSQGLQPHPEGWRATKRYLEQTNAVLADPRGRLPHYPMVLPRGGWPDGS